MNDKDSRVITTDDGVDENAATDAQARDREEFRQYRAPHSHGESFIDPGFADVPGVLRDNITLLESQDFPSATLRRQARKQLIEDAIDYTSAYRDVHWAKSLGGGESIGPILMAGHQPALFHPGVWFKNFALSHLAKQNGAVAVNLVIDNDVASGSSIRVPTFEPVSGRAGYQAIAYDEAGGGVPYEQTTINDRETFDSFDRRVAEAIGPLVETPCVIPLWQHARRAIERCGVAGCALAQARHGLEGELGLETLELPLGVVCRTTAFAEFALTILSELPRFHRCYNDAANRYRKAHGIRSSAHPVPNLAEDGQWFEAPMWIYGNDSPQRKQAWARLSDNDLVISDRGQRELRIDIRYPKLAAEQLATLASPNFKLRPRALLTTMYARLVLSDLFLHGIGGGKYDQLGDMIMQSFFMVSPPKFMVVSATLQLPGTATTNESGEIRRLKRLIRETRYQGERFVDQVTLDPVWVARKRELLDNVPPKGSRKAWHDEMTQINEALSAQLRSQRETLRSELAAVEKRVAAAELLASREYPFCLFPLDYLTETYESMLGNP